MKQELERIGRALEAAAEIARRYTPGAIAAEDKGGGDPVTEADHALDAALKEMLPEPADGWLSEETADSPERLDRSRVWVVDPLDGTREFVQGIPEWCISIGLVEDGLPVAGGICNPATGETILGARGLGVTYNGRPVELSDSERLDGGVVLASRSEIKRGEWERFKDSAFEVRPMGSVAYKMGLVAAGRATATWTLVPKHEWDIAGGAALVLAAGGTVYGLDGRLPRFNREKPKVTGFVAHPTPLTAAVRREIGFSMSLD